MKNRQTIRLQGYNYSLPGAYFVTICVQHKRCLFGEIINGKMILNKIGEIIKTQWLSLPTRFSNITLDEFIIMPNHIHGIIIIAPVPEINVGATLAVARNEIAVAKQTDNNVKQMGYNNKRATPVIKWAMPVIKRATTRVAPTDNLKTNNFTIGQIIGAFKSLCVTNYLKYIKNNLANMPLNRLWQRNYYEHIIRNEIELNNIRQYIKNNPIKWQNDNYYG